jgi:glucose/mannose transport system permease protein
MTRLSAAGRAPGRSQAGPRPLGGPADVRVRRGAPAWAAYAALLPMAFTVIVIYLGTVAWSIGISFTSSKSLPRSDFVGIEQYERLFDTERWTVSLQNMALFGGAFLSLCLLTGFLLAVFIDQKVRAEGLLRSFFLYPFAMSFIATGVVWQWMLNPELGLQASVRNLGWKSFRFDWIVDQDMAIFTIAIAAIWHGAGLVMALMLAGLRGIDESLWSAARIEGVPRWRYYAQIVLPQLGPTLATCLVLLSLGVVRLYDTVLVMTQGGPGMATEVPAKFIMDHIGQRANIGLASAASTVMLITVLAVLAPWLYWRSRKQATR